MDRPFTLGVATGVAAVCGAAVIAAIGAARRAEAQAFANVEGARARLAAAQVLTGGWTMDEALTWLHREDH